MKNNQLINSIEKTLNSVINIINSDINEFNIDLWKKEKSKHSSSVLSRKLGLNDSLYNEFETALYQFEQYKDDIKKSKIACFRISLWLETVCKKLNLHFSIDESISNEQLAIKQVRALELLIRDVVNENLGGNQNVLLKLQELFKQEIVEKWIKSADETGVLSGTTFSELSNIFLDKDIFKSIEELVESSNLKLSKNNRDSLRYILEDIRLIRNSIAHNKKISNIQIDALNEYYLEISNLIKESKSNTINPEAYLDLDMANLEEFLSNLKHDNRTIGTNIEEIKTDLKEVKNNTSAIHRKTYFIIGGIISIIFITGIILYFVSKQSGSTSEISKDLKVVKEVVTKGGGRVIDANSYNELKHNLYNQLTSREESLDILSKMFSNFSNESKNDLKAGLYTQPLLDYNNFNNSQLFTELLWLRKLNDKNKNQEINAEYSVLRIKDMLQIMLNSYWGLNGYNNLSNVPIEKRYSIIVDLSDELNKILSVLPLKDVKSIKVVFYAIILQSFVDPKKEIEIRENLSFYDDLKQSENFKTTLKLFTSNLTTENGEYITVNNYGKRIKLSINNIKNWEQLKEILRIVDSKYSEWSQTGKKDFTLVEN
jgi:hypothetical protein